MREEGEGTKAIVRRVEVKAHGVLGMAKRGVAEDGRDAARLRFIKTESRGGRSRPTYKRFLQCRAPSPISAIPPPMPSFPRFLPPRDTVV